MKINFISPLFFTFLFNNVNAQLADSLTKKVDAIFAEYDKTNSPTKKGHQERLHPLK